MNRLKLLATATLMALTFTACDEGTPPPVEPPPPPTPVGTISGAVTIEGTAASGITATLSSGATTTTGSGGNFAFSGVEAGTYTVTISGFPEDATFAEVTQSATIATDGQNVQLNFAGEYVRTSSVVGNVVAADAMMSGGDGQPETLAGVTVTLSGEHAMADPMKTGMDGGFMFTGLRAGTYTVTISDFPEDVSFETLSVDVEVEVGEVGSADFTGHFIRTSAVEGQVIIEGEGLAGVTVTLSGGPAEEMYTMMTDADGMYRFEELRPGDYMVSISDFDTRDYEFASTSADVSVDLDETGTVDFTGVLLRTSGIAGRVSVEGMGLPDIEVTLAGGDDSRTAMTDAGGQYSFAGLAAGDYTVSIAVESDAYVFESMSADVTLGDDESAIQNFEGLHARTASVSGMVFIDELMKNDMFDEGEHPLPQAGLPVALVGPGVNEQRLGATDAMGAFSFSELQAGPYQLVVLLSAEVATALAAADLAYGGPGEGYAINVGVGESAAQNVPFDITHTTINVAVTLKGGDYRGDLVPGATVDLFADAEGETKIGSGTTMAGEHGVYTSIKVSRAATSDNTVHMSVGAEGYFVDPTAGMQAVTWDPQSFTHPAMGADPPAVLNEADIVNLNVDVSVSGATVTTDYGGGDALAGWAIAVVTGDPTDPTSLMPVEGAPMMLGEKDADDEGMASFMTAVMPDGLPATYVIALADDQDDKMDGGENYAAQPIVHTHTGLKLAGNQDAGTLEAAFTTQTLKVSVHHELDQVMGFTGNIIGGDETDGSGDARKVDVELRYIDDSGRSRAFTAADSISEPRGNGDGGAWVFNNVPADMNVIVQASKADDDDKSVMLLDEGGHSDELAAYTGTEVNGITGGHFGAQGGYSHTVSLCPLQDTNPQDHGECSSFAYVSTHSVTGLVWKNQVLRSTEGGANDDGFLMGPEDDMGPTFVPGITVGLSPVEGKNLAGDEESSTTAEEDDDDTEDIAEDHQFAFNNIASGVYKLSVTDGWRARTPAATDDLGDDTPKGATGMVGDALNPLAGDVSLDVTPTTSTVYGYVRDADEFPVDSVTVTVNGVEAMSDVHGRYIAEYVPSANNVRGRTTHRNTIAVTTDHEGTAATDSIFVFAANSRFQVDVALGGVGSTASVSGTVTASGSGAPIAGVEIKVDGAAPNNAATRGANSGKLVTGADGTYTAVFDAKDLGATVSLTASKEGLSFSPSPLCCFPAHAGSESSGANFTGFQHARISGRVRGPDGNALGGVAVTATNVTDSAQTPVESTSNARGTFVLSVPFGTYDIEAALENHIFGYPNDNQRVSTAPGQSLNFGDIRAKTAMARNVTATRLVVPNATDTTVMNYGNIRVTFVADSTAIPVGYSETVVYAVQTNTGADGAFDTQSSVGDSLADGIAQFASPHDTTLMVRVLATLTNDTNVDPQHDTDLTLPSAVRTIAAVDPSASNVKARIGVTADTTVADTIVVTWDATSNSSSDYRVAVQLAPASLNGQTFWFVAAGGTPADPGADDREWTLETPAPGSPVTWNIARADGTNGTAAVITSAELSAATMVRVESVQGTASEDNPWKASAAAAVTGGS